MSSPKITTNSVPLQQAFDAYSEYLDEQMIERDNFSAQFGEGPGISIREDADGKLIFEGRFDDLTPETPWQLIRVEDRLHILPGLVQYKEVDEDIYTDVTPHLKGGTPADTSLTTTPRPFWSLPLTPGGAYTVYLVVDVDHTVETANVFLIEDGVEDILDEADEDSRVIILHEFIASTATSFGPDGSQTSQAGYPEFTEDSARFRSDVILSLGTEGPLRMFDLKVIGKGSAQDDEIKIVPGIYERDGNVAWVSDSTYTADSLFTRDYDFISSLTTKDVVWVYAILNTTDDLTKYLSTMDFNFGSLDFSAGGKLQILFKDEPFVDDVSFRSSFDPFKQIKLIGMLKLTAKGGGKFAISSKQQIHRGSIDPGSLAWNSSKGSVGSPLDDILKIDYSFTSAVLPFTTGQTSMSADFAVDGSTHSVRRNRVGGNFIDTLSVTDLDLQFHYVALQDPSVTPWTKDVSLFTIAGSSPGLYHRATSLIPSSTDWSNWHKLAFETKKVADGTHNYYLFTLYPNNWSQLDGFYARPDGTLINETDGRSSSIDSDILRTRSMNYNTTGAAKSEDTLQWYRLYEEVRVASDIGNFDDDAIIGALRYNTAATIDLDYYRIDAGFKGLSTSSDWDQPMSLQIVDLDRAQIFAFDNITDSDAPGPVSGGVLAPSDTARVSDWFNLSAAPSDDIEKHVMVRCRKTGFLNRPYVGYANLTNYMHVFDKLSIDPLDAAANLAQIHGFDVAANTTGAGSLVLVKKTGIVQYVNFDDFSAGGNWDECSINAPTLAPKSGQLRNYDTATSVVADLESADLFPFKDDSDGGKCISYVNIDFLSRSLRGNSHHALPAWDAVRDVIGSTWSDFDDHGGANRIGGGTVEITDGFPLFVLGSPNATSKAGMYTRNSLGANDNYFGNDLFIETHLHVDTINTEASSLSIDVLNRKLISGAIERLRWNDGGVGDVAVDATAKFKVNNSTAGTPVFGTPAMSVAGGAYFGDSVGVAVVLSSATTGGDFSNGSFRGLVATGTHGGLFDNLGTDPTAKLASATVAGDFSDGTRTALICDGTHAVNATIGNMNVVSGGYRVADIQIIGAQQAAQADIDIPGGSLARDGALRAEWNTFLAKVRASTGHGIIAG